MWLILVKDIKRENNFWLIYKNVFLILPKLFRYEKKYLVVILLLQKWKSNFEWKRKW